MIPAHQLSSLIKSKYIVQPERWKHCMRARAWPLLRAEAHDGFVMTVVVSRAGVDYATRCRVEYPDRHSPSQRYFIEFFAREVDRAFDAAFDAVTLGQLARLEGRVSDEAWCAAWRDAL